MKKTPEKERGGKNEKMRGEDKQPMGEKTKVTTCSSSI